MKISVASSWLTHTLNECLLPLMMAFNVDEMDYKLFPSNVVTDEGLYALTQNVCNILVDDVSWNFKY